MNTKENKGCIVLTIMLVLAMVVLILLGSGVIIDWLHG
jgi:hypothetical protein